MAFVSMTCLTPIALRAYGGCYDDMFCLSECVEYIHVWPLFR